jgi:hypothetical protein
VGARLTTGDNNPDEVHEEVVAPEVIWLWSAIGETSVVVVKHASGVVEYVTVYLAD